MFAEKSFYRWHLFDDWFIIFTHFVFLLTFNTRRRDALIIVRDLEVGKGDPQFSQLGVPAHRSWEQILLTESRRTLRLKDE